MTIEQITALKKSGTESAQEPITPKILTSLPHIIIQVMPGGNLVVEGPDDYILFCDMMLDAWKIMMHNVIKAKGKSASNLILPSDKKILKI